MFSLLRLAISRPVVFLAVPGASRTGRGVQLEVFFCEVSVLNVDAGLLSSKSSRLLIRGCCNKPVLASIHGCCSVLGLEPLTAPAPRNGTCLPSKRWESYPEGAEHKTAMSMGNAMRCFPAWAYVSASLSADLCSVAPFAFCVQASWYARLGNRMPH